MDAPDPAPDVVSAPYWEAAARGELLIQECPAAATGSSIRGHVHGVRRRPRMADVSGRGTVHTFTVIRQNTPSRSGTSCPTSSPWSSSKRAPA